MAIEIILAQKFRRPHLQACAEGDGHKVIICENLDQALLVCRAHQGDPVLLCVEPLALGFADCQAMRHLTSLVAQAGVRATINCIASEVEPLK